MNPEQWHEVAGVIVRNEHGEILLFDRARPPFGYTVPAGHIESLEDPRVAAQRELFEETGLKIAGFSDLVGPQVEMIRGDVCRRGKPNHQWYVFHVEKDWASPIVLNEEGKHAVWVSPAAALELPLTHATRHVLTRHAAFDG